MSGGSLPTILADAVGLWRSQSVPQDWTPAVGWPNEGTGGAAMDLIAASEGSGDLDTSPTVTATDANRVTPSLSAAGFVIGYADGTADNGADDFGFFSLADFDFSGSYSWTHHFAPDNIGVSSVRYLWQGGPFSHDGVIVEDTDQSTGGTFVIYVGDEATFNGTPPYAGFGADNGDPVEGMQAVTFVVDRDAGEFRCYRDGVALEVDLSDISSMGDCTAPGFPLILGPNQTVADLVFHTRALSAVEVAAEVAAL